MVNTSTHIPKPSKDYITPAVVGKSMTKRFEIIPGTGTSTYNKEDGQQQTKPWITVLMDGIEYQWTLSATANKMLAIDFGLGFETEEWVGAIGQLMVVQLGGHNSVIPSGVIKGNSVVTSPGVVNEEFVA